MGKKPTNKKGGTNPKSTTTTSIENNNDIINQQDDNEVNNDTNDGIEHTNDISNDEQQQQQPIEEISTEPIINQQPEPIIDESSQQQEQLVQFEENLFTPAQPQQPQEQQPIVEENLFMPTTTTTSSSTTSSEQSPTLPSKISSPTTTTTISHDDEEELDLSLFQDEQTQEIAQAVVPNPDGSIPTPPASTDETIKKAEEEKLPPSPFSSLFRFATAFDYLLILFGMFGALGNGFLLPLSSLLMGEALNKMQDDFESFINEICFLFFALGICSMLCGLFQTFCFTLSSERQGKALREAYLKALFRQDMTFHDTQIAGKDVASKITEYTATVQNGLADKFGAIISSFSSFIFALVLAFTKGWSLSLVLLAPIPLLFIVIGIVMSKVSKIKVEEQKAYAKANVLATETFDNIQTVKVYGMATNLIERYKTYLIDAYKLGKKSSYVSGAAFMTFLTLMFSMYALGIWYSGVYLIARGKHTFGPNSALYNGGSTIAIFYILLSAMQQIGGSMANFTAVASARASMSQLLQVIDRQSEIDAFDFADDYSLQRREWLERERIAIKNGLKIHTHDSVTKQLIPIGTRHIFTQNNKYLVTRFNFTGSIRFENVSFSYPSRPTQLVLNNFSYEFIAGQSYGIVSSSGGGKSTICSLIQRFYDPNQGEIFIEIYDGINPGDCTPNAKFPIPGETPTKWVNLKDIYIGPWRQYCIGSVPQESPLVPGTIADNIRFGNPHATDEEIITAAILSDSHDFIMKKEGHYNSYLSAGSLSGGQTQRIGIARALLTKPAILLLDEFSSGLDYVTEHRVASNLATLRANNNSISHRDEMNQVGGKHVKLNITIAHRLVTVRNSFILGMKDGNIVESGYHDDLLTKYPNGIYSQMYHAHPDPLLTGAIVKNNNDDDEHTTINNNNKSQDGKSLVVSNKFTLQARDILQKQHLYIRPSDFISSTDKYLQEQKRATNVSRSTRAFRFSRLIKHIFYNHPILMFISLISIAIGGASFPFFSWIFGHALKALYQPSVDMLIREVKKYALYFVIFAVGAGINTFFTYTLLGVVSEKVIKFFRAELFNNIIQQEMGFFDQETNSTGILTTKLAKDTSQIRAFITSFFQSCLSFIAQLIITIIMAYHTSPKMTLIMCLVFPLNALSSYLHFRFVRGFAGTAKEHLESAGVIAVSAMKNVSTIATFNVQNWTWIKFSHLNDDALWTGMVGGLYSACGFGFSQFCFYFASALIYYFGGHLVINGEIAFNDFFQVSQAMRFASQQFSVILGQMSSLDAMNAAISDMYDLMDRKSLDDAYLIDNCMTSTEAKEYTKTTGKEFKPITTGQIEFKNVKFHYPTNRSLPILRGISFSTPKRDNNDKGYVLSICGSSGNGKSTIMNLLLHYYQTVQPNGNSRLILTKKQEYYNKYIRPKWRELLASYDNNNTNTNTSINTTTNDTKVNKKSQKDGFKESLLNNSDDNNNDDDAKPFLQQNTINNTTSDDVIITINDPLPLSSSTPLLSNDDTTPLDTNNKLGDMTPAERAEYTKQKSIDFEIGGELRNPDTSGTITIDGRDITTIPLQELYKYMSVVPQQAQIFNDTVFENIRCYNTTITRDDVIAAAKKAQIHDIIMRLPKQYDCIIDTKKMSVGQKQRIAIARAIVRNPIILCLDEPSSALDAINSAKVHAALDEAMKGKITITIAHRLETISKADSILVLDRGTIVEQGSHDELLQYSADRLKQGLSPGVYATFLDSTISQ